MRVLIFLALLLIYLPIEFLCLPELALSVSEQWDIANSRFCEIGLVIYFPIFVGAGFLLWPIPLLIQLFSTVNVERFSPVVAVPILLYAIAMLLEQVLRQILKALRRRA